ncbi:hypothetical protein Egran_02677 [Elaphomyces granulatus]|uniref:CCZ1/INTU/HSP4 first Longin domain-containing protein n=1 Tax=Elaphomyces granulatus TaxID=519963 RepID=A0A232LZG6_9EURO|nr:hypothetical protein Egran_02677 [Elaphomyces granulatus]
MPEGESNSVVPAQLSFLAIYNPLLATGTDETLSDQIVFYSSKASRSRQKGRFPDDSIAEDKNDRNERLRQIGLAQGMVNFAKNFSEGRPMDYVETEKSRVVLHELEENWWILASIDLNRLPTGGTALQSTASASSAIEYSSREVCPPLLLINQLRRAHGIFLLHHDATLDELYRRVGRSAFCISMTRFWTKFIRNWEILLHGNPTVNIFNSIKLAIGGELGIGVGEEEWGSGEREVLEDFVARTNGLIELVVSRFGDASPPEPIMSKRKSSSANAAIHCNPWLGSDKCPRPTDGVIFSGVGAITRSALSQVSHWMEWIYRFGEAAYGVRDNPSSARRRRQHKRRVTAPVMQTALPPRSGSKSAVLGTPKPQTQDNKILPGVPPPLITATPTSSQVPKGGVKSQTDHRYNHATDEVTDDSSRLFGTETIMKFLTLGYGSSWGVTPSLSTVQDDSVVSTAHVGKHQNDRSNRSSQLTTGQDTRKTGNRKDTTIHNDDSGRFILGLRDDLEDEGGNDSEFEQHQGNTEFSSNRILLKTLHLQINEQVASNKESEGSSANQYKRVQVLVYVRRPFMFTFLFELQTPVLSSPPFYHSIHHQLGPLQRPLLSSTSPLNTFRRRTPIMSDHRPSTSTSSHHERSRTPNQPVYDLVYDPSDLTIRSSIPNIPEPPPAADAPLSQNPAWSRIEALNVHNQLLSTYIDTRSLPLEVERRCKTGRGWWLVWARVPKQQMQDDEATATSEPDAHHERGHGHDPPREVYLVRKANDTASSSSSSRRTHSSSLRFFRDLSGGVSSSSAGASLSAPPAAVSGSIGTGRSEKLVMEGLGFDTRKYIETLLSLHT